MNKSHDGFKRVLVMGLCGMLPALASAAPAASEAFAAQPATNALKLWYAKPAKGWDTEALPLGNGRLGAMVFGAESEHIQFNEDSLWVGDEQDTGSYQNFGDVYVNLRSQPQAPLNAYRRELDLSRAVHSVSYEQGGVKYSREYFASHPANVMVFRFTADKPAAYSGEIVLRDAHQARIVARGNKLIATGSLAGHKPSELGWCGNSSKDKNRVYAFGLDYESQLLVRHEGGTVEAKDGKLVFNQVNSLTLYLDAGTDFVQDRSKKWRGTHPHAALEARLQAAADRPYATLLAEHVKDYQSLFNRVALNLGDAAGQDLPTDERLLKYRLGRMPYCAEILDPGLEVLAFQMGRYILISSSRGALPANLQGLWCGNNAPMCRGDFHTDINVQMNYWPAEVANLSECFLPFANWLNSIREVRKADTYAEFQARGWTMRAENGIFGGSTWDPVPSGSAWCLQNVWDHYAFTGDKEYLRTLAYPMMKEVCEFWCDRLKALPDGTLVAPNGLSPEQGPREDGVSHDQQLAWDLFNNTVEAADILGVDRAFRDQIAAKRDKLLGPKIGKWGQLQEWMVDRDDPKNVHRHCSHLVAVYPGRQIAPTKTPDLALAAAVSLQARGPGSPSWSRAWKINLWARLGDGERAWWQQYYLLSGTLLLGNCNQGSFFPNLFSNGGTLQVDGNCGYTAGICEMLLQSHLGEIALMPAWPRAWSQGSVRGLRARGAVTVDMAWDIKVGLKSVRLTADRDGQYKVRLPGKALKTVALKAGQPWIMEK